MTRRPAFACDNADGTPKRGYPTRQAAEIGARRTRRDNLRDAAGLGVYRCSSCRQFHIGHGGPLE